MQNDWNRVRKHYARHHAAIMAESGDEWGIDAYAWEDAGIRMTPIESWLWGDIRAANMVMYPQYPVNGVFVDFGNPRAKVAIECDGKEFHTDKAKDAARDRDLEKLGWTVYRLTGAQCREDSDPDTGAPGYAGRIIAMIAQNHRVQRGRVYA